MHIREVPQDSSKQARLGKQKELVLALSFVAWWPTQDGRITLFASISMGVTGVYDRHFQENLKIQPGWRMAEESGHWVHDVCAWE